VEVGWVVRLYTRTFLLLLSAELCSAAAAAAAIVESGSVHTMLTFPYILDGVLSLCAWFVWFAISLLISFPQGLSALKIAFIGPLDEWPL
jgi:hypothetical protein